MNTYTLGELISSVYDEFLDQYGDPDIASVATAAFINELLSRETVEKTGTFAA